MFIMQACICSEIEIDMKIAVNNKDYSFFFELPCFVFVASINCVANVGEL